VRRFENERVLAVGARRLGVPVDGAEQPAAVVGRAQKRGKARLAIEPRPAQPVDGALLGDECRRLTVADQGIVFDLGRRGASSPVSLFKRPARCCALKVLFLTAKLLEAG
jgi:hypothetical protein